METTQPLPELPDTRRIAGRMFPQNLENLLPRRLDEQGEPHVRFRHGRRLEPEENMGPDAHLEFSVLESFPDSGLHPGKAHPVIDPLEGRQTHPRGRILQPLEQNAAFHQIAAEPAEHLGKV